MTRSARIEAMVVLFLIACGKTTGSASGALDGGPSASGAASMLDATDATDRVDSADATGVVGSGGTLGTGGEPAEAGSAGGSGGDSCTGYGMNPDGSCTEPPVFADEAVCPASPADDHGEACSVDGACGHDFGDGCTTSAFEAVGDTDDALSACEAGFGEPGVFASGEIWSVAVGGGYVCVVSVAALTIYEAASCTVLLTYTPSEGTLTKVVATTSTAYVAVSVPATTGVVGTPRVVAVPFSGEVPMAVDLGDVVPPDVEGAVPLVASETSAYVLAGAGQARHPGQFIVELPCCGAPPRLLGPTPLEISYGTIFAQVDGPDLVLAANPAGFDGPLATAGRIDTVTGESTLIFQGIREEIGGVDVYGGGAYFVLRDNIVRFDLQSRDWELVESYYPGGSTTGLLVTDDMLVWAQRYDDYTASKILSRTLQGEPIISHRLQPSGTVTWMDEMDGAIYFLEETSPAAPLRLMRLR